jgi:hypothetical protein
MRRAVRTGCLRCAKTPNVQVISQSRIQGNSLGEKALLARIKLLNLHESFARKKFRAKLRREPRRSSTRPE